MEFGPGSLNYFQTHSAIDLDTDPVGEFLMTCLLYALVDSRNDPLHGV